MDVLGSASARRVRVCFGINHAVTVPVFRVGGRCLMPLPSDLGLPLNGTTEEVVGMVETRAESSAKLPADLAAVLRDVHADPMAMSDRERRQCVGVLREAATKTVREQRLRGWAADQGVESMERVHTNILPGTGEIAGSSSGRR